MTRKALTLGVALLVSLPLISAAGCASVGPNLGIMAYPIPVSPFFQKRFEDHFHEHKRYNRVPILGPLVAGGPVQAMDPPSDDEVIRALESVRPSQGGIPFLHEVSRDNVRIIVEPIADYVDPPRVYPLIGPAQLHHAHYKCLIYFTETTRVGWPIPYTTVAEVHEVLYIDHNHFHMVGDVDGGPGAEF